MAEKQIMIRLTVDDQGSVVVKQFGKNTEEALTRAEGTAGGFASKVKGHFTGLSAAAVAATAALVTINKAMVEYEAGARAIQAEDTFRMMADSAGINSDRLVAAMQYATRETIDASDMMQKAAKGIALGLEGNDIINIASAARYAARLTGEDVKTAYESITDSIANQMPRALRRYGLITKEELKLVERAIQVGVEDIRVMDIAMANAAVQQSRFGIEAETSAEKVQRLKANIKDLGESLQVGLVNAIDAAIDGYMRLGEFASRAQRMGWSAAWNYDQKTEDEKARMQYGSVLGIVDLEGERQSWYEKSRIREAITKHESMKKLAEIAKLNAQLKDEIAKLTLSEEQQIIRRGGQMRAEGRSPALISEWQIAALGKREEEIWKARIEASQKGELDLLNIEKGLVERRLKVQEDIDPAAAVEARYKAEEKILAAQLRQNEIKQALYADDRIKLAAISAEAETIRAKIGAIPEMKRLDTAAATIEDQRKAYETIKDFAQGYTLFQEKQLDRLVDSFQSAGIAEIDIERWKVNELKRLAIQRAQHILENTNDWDTALKAKFDLMHLQSRNSAQIWADSMGEIYDGAFQTINDVFFDAIEGRMDSFTDYVKAFTTIVNRALAELATDLLKSKITKGISGTLSTGGSFTDFLSGGLSLLTGGTYGTAWGDIPGVGTLDVSGGDFILGRANGGPVTARRPYWVGERGVPELFIPETNGTIVPRAALRGAGSTLNLQSTINFGVPGLSATQLAGLHKELEEATTRVVDQYVRRHM